MSQYEKPHIVDLGDLQEMTQATGQLGGEDGTGKTINATVGPVDVSVGVFP